MPPPPRKTNSGKNISETEMPSVKMKAKNPPSANTTTDSSSSKQYLKKNLEDSVSTFRDMVPASSKFVIVRVGPKENFSLNEKSGNGLLKYSIDADAFYYAMFYHPETLEEYQAVLLAKNKAVAICARENIKLYHPNQKVLGFGLSDESVVEAIHHVNSSWTEQNNAQLEFIKALASTNLPRVRLLNPNLNNVSRKQLEKEVEVLMQIDSGAKQQPRKSTRPISDSEDSVNYLNTVLMSESDYDEKFIVVRIGPKESFDRTDKQVLQHSIAAEEYYYALFYHPEVVQQFHAVFFAKSTAVAHCARDNLRKYHPKFKVIAYNCFEEEMKQQLMDMNQNWTEQNNAQLEFIKALASTNLPRVRLLNPNLTTEEKAKLEKEMDLKMQSSIISSKNQLHQKNGNTPDISLDDGLEDIPRGARI